MPIQIPPGSCRRAKPDGQGGHCRCLRMALIPVAVLTALAVPAGAAAAGFDDLAARLDEHPSVAALREQARSSEDLARAARGLPDPMLSFSVNNVPITDPAFDRFLPSNKSVGIEQRIPNAGVRRAHSARELTRSRQFDLKASYQVSRLRAELAGVLADIARVDRQRDHARSQRRLYDEMERILRGELEAGRPVYFRLSEIDVERADVDRRLNDLRNERAAAEATLIQLVGEASAVPPPDVALQRWNGDPQTLYPVRIAEADISMAQAGVREGKAEYGPDIGLRLQYQQREEGVSDGGMPFAGDDWFSAGVSVSVPLWAAQNQAPRLRAARARESAARASLHDALRQARERLTALYSDHDSARSNIQTLGAKEQSLRELIASATRTYEAGQGTYIQILDGEIGRLTLRSRIEDERARLLKTAAKANSYLVPP